MRLVVSFLLLFTTSGDVVCSKFGEVWETLWIFKVVRWTCDRWPKINKSPTVSNGIGVSSFEIWTANFGSVTYCGHPNKLTELHLWRFKLEILQSWLPRRPPKTWQSDADISDFGFLFFNAFIFLWKKIKTCWIYNNTVFANWGKYEVSWNFCLVFIVDF